MLTFLESLAKKYAEEYKGDFADVCFVFPGKRASSFFLRYFRNYVKEDVVFLPAVTTIADFVESLSGKVVDSRIDQLCQLYAVYCDIWHKKGNEPVAFDRFQAWGETMLSDFNDVEMYRVNAEALYRNVRQLKSIRSNHLDEEQMKVMRDYFGFSELYEDPTRLWQHYGGSGSKAKNRFLTLWDAMGEIYEEYCKALDKRGLTFSGRSYVQALKALGEKPEEVLPWKRIVMVGFNALSTVEFQLFKTLSKAKTILADGTVQPFADFYWDCTGVPFSFDDNIGKHFIIRNRKHFHSIYNLDESDCNTLPKKIETIVSPSGVGQAKIASAVLKKVLEHRHEEKKRDDTEVAIVLPDENLLLPMLYSLPKDLPEVNLTMGYSFRLTSVATFVSLLETYQNHLNIQDEEWQAMAQDVNALLSHPLSLILIGSTTVSAIKQKLEKLRRLTVSAKLLTIYNEACKLIFTPLGKRATAFHALDYLLAILERVELKLDVEADGDEKEKQDTGDVRIKNRLDKDHVESYIDALHCVKDAFSKYKIGAGAKTSFRLARGLLATETVHFEGEPLRGVQIMGPLETRCLDFKTVILPSMNERIYPRKLHNKSFIPAVIRRGFGIATTRFQEAIFTYYFYRMISRAEEVYMIYDSRNEGLHSGSPSRFILQLEHLYAKGCMTHSRYRFDLNTHERTKVEVKKTDEMMARLKEYMNPEKKGRYTLSASSLNTYISCPLCFYLKTLRGVSHETQLIEGLQASDLGNVVHKALEDIYLSMSDTKPYTVTPTMLAGINDKAIDRFLEEAVKKEYYKNQPVTKIDSTITMAIPHMREMVKRVLAYDLSQTPFDFVMAEQRKPMTLRLPSGREVNFLYIIDRIDCRDLSDSSAPVRIVDYKTGSYHVECEDMDSLFTSDHPKELVQLMLYAILLKKDNGTPRDVSIVIYDVSKINISGATNGTPVIPKIGGEKISTVGEYSQDLLERLDTVLGEMFDQNTPFYQAPEGAYACKYCPFRESVCGI